MSVIVTNARSRIAYNVVRSLGQKDVTVWTADSIPRAMSYYSRYSRDHFLYPSPFTEPEGFLSRLVERISQMGANVLIPVYEETFLIAKHAERFSSRVAMVVPDYQKILIAHNKDRWAKIATALDIPVPRSISIDEIREGSVAASDLRFPVLVKPKQGGGAWGIVQLNSAAELTDLLGRGTRDGMPWSRFFVQEKVDGETHCVAMLMCHGQFRAKVAYRQLRDYPLRGGQATLRESLRSHPAEAYLQRFLESIDWHGVCQADFVVDRMSKVPYLIDLNPRLWGSLVQAIASGVDFPHLLYRMARDGDVPVSESFGTGVVTRWLGGEIGALLQYVRTSRSASNGSQRFFVKHPRVSLLDDFSMADPLPFGAWVADAIVKALRSRSLSASSHDSLAGIWE